MSEHTATGQPQKPPAPLPSHLASEVTMDNCDARLRQIEQHYNLPTNHLAWAIGSPGLILGSNWAGTNGNSITGTMGIVTALEGATRTIVGSGVAIEPGEVLNAMFQNLATNLPGYVTQLMSGAVRRAA